MIDLLARRHHLPFEPAPAGRVVVEARWRRPDADVLLVKPLTFMNLSGGAVGEVARFYKIDLPDVLVVCDDVNLPLGRLRARASGSEGGHNGLRSIAEHLGTIDYARLRIGVGRGDVRRDLADHVLAPVRAGRTGRDGRRDCPGGRRRRGVDLGRLGACDEHVQSRGRQRVTTAPCRLQ